LNPESDEKMQHSGRLLLALFLLAAGCAHAATPGAVPPEYAGSPAERTGDLALYQILGKVPLDSAAEQALQRYELEHEGAFLENVAEVAADPAAGTAARYNAVMLLGDRQGANHLMALRDALSDRDPRVRAAVVVAAGKIMGNGQTGRALIVSALDDPAPEVQGKALEVLGTSDAPLLRAFLARHPQGEATVIARGLLQAAEERGAPLASDSAGGLHRMTAGGLRLDFQPTQRWPKWEAAVGTVTIGRRTSPAFSIPDVEVVAGIVPAFFAPDESAIVYEQARHIYVRDLRTGAVRELGSGIAPRPLPFTEDFVYLREAAGGGDLRERTRVNYDVLRASFRAGAGDPRPIGKLGVFTEARLHGNYSPARWLQVVARGTQFTLEAEGAETFRLPDPFHPGTTS